MEYSRLYAMPYFLIILLFLLFFMFERSVIYTRCYNGFANQKKIKVWALYFLSCYLIVIFIGFRGDVNTDWSTYKNVYENILTRKISAGPEILFWYSMYIGKALGLSYTNYIFFSTLVDIILITLIIKNKNNMFLALALFFIFSGGLGFRLEFNLQRNIKSILLFAYSVRFLSSRRIAPYFLVNIFGALFHVTSLIYLPLYFVLHKDFNKKYLIFFLVLGNLVYVFSVKWLAMTLVFLSSFFPSRITYLIDVYTASEIFSQAKSFSSGYIEKIIIFLLALKCHNSLVAANKENIVWLNLVYVFCALQFFCSELIIIPDRLALLFLPGLWFVFSQSYDLGDRRYKLIFMVVLVLYVALKHFMTPSPEYLDYESTIFHSYS